MVNRAKEAVGSPRKDRLKKGGPGGTRKLVPEGSEGFYGEPGGAYKTAALSRVYTEEAFKIQAIVRYTFVYETFSIYHRQMMLLYALL